MTPQLQKLLDDLRSGATVLKPNLKGSNVIYLNSGASTFTGTVKGGTTITVKHCQHPNLPRIPFDPVAARDMTSAEVRKRWPRLGVTCPDCKSSVMSYASHEHYIAGDW